MKSKLIYYENLDETLDIGYIDYKMKMFDEDYYQIIYHLDKENKEKLEEFLYNEGMYGKLKNNIINYFGPTLNKIGFSKTLKDNNIEFTIVNE